MARVVLILDSETGELVDASGAPCESARYLKFAQRMLPPGKNPTLAFDGKTLTLSSGEGLAGSTIRLAAATVRLSGSLLDKDGNPIGQMSDAQIQQLLGKISGKEDEISVTPKYDEEGSSPGVVTGIEISFSESFASQIESLQSDVDDLKEHGTATDVLDGQSMPALPTQNQLTEAVKKIWGALGGSFS